MKFDTTLLATDLSQMRKRVDEEQEFSFFSWSILKHKTDKGHKMRV